MTWWIGMGTPCLERRCLFRKVSVFCEVSDVHRLAGPYGRWRVTQTWLVESGGLVVVMKRVDALTISVRSHTYRHYPLHAHLQQKSHACG